MTPAIAQDAKVRPVALGRVGRAQGLGVNGRDQCVAVVFIQARPAGHFGHRLQALGNALQGFGVAAQGAGHHRVKRHAPPAPVLAQAHRLLMSARAEHVVIISAKRGLAVAHEVEGSPGGGF